MKKPKTYKDTTEYQLKKLGEAWNVFVREIIEEIEVIKKRLKKLVRKKGE